MKGFFITGTGTGVGKTLVTALTTRVLLQAGHNVVPIKPIQTGADPRTGSAPDIDEVLGAVGLDVEPARRRLLAPLVYTPACSPHLAARLANHKPDLDLLMQGIRAVAARHDGVVVEGAGGALVPLDDSHLMIDLMSWLGLPVIVASAAGLGTINHTLLTLEALRWRGIEVAGVLLNEVDKVPDSDMYLVKDNADAIARFGQVKVFGRVRHLWRGDGWKPGALDTALADLGDFRAFLTGAFQ